MPELLLGRQCPGARHRERRPLHQLPKHPPDPGRGGPLTAQAPAVAPRDGDRYSRHRAIEGFSQESLAAARIVVVGAGAIGNEVVKNLCLLGVGHVDVHDFDRVERHNLTRSILLREADVGQPKSTAVVARAGQIDASVRLRAFDGDIRDTLQPSHVRTADLVIGAVDNFEARLWINRLCLLLGRDWVNAAIDHRHASIETFRFAGEPGACYECGLPDSVHARVAERYSCGGLLRAALAERVMPTTTITASLAGALAVQQALARATSSQRILLDSRTGRSSVAEVRRREDCPGCAGLPEPRPLSVVALPGATAAAVARWVRHHAPEPSIVLAEALVWSARCSHCGDTDATQALVGRPARLLRDTATFCFRCGHESIAIDLRDQTDADELQERFGETALPLAFVQAGTHLLDLGSD